MFASAAARRALLPRVASVASRVAGVASSSSSSSRFASTKGRADLLAGAG
jgi:hypothetical protein